MKDVLKKFDGFLERKGLFFEGVVIGAAALIVMEIIDRRTKDVDFLDPNISDEIKTASVEFSVENPQLKLQENWLNNGPASLKRDLESDWRSHIIEIYTGPALKLYTLGRRDLIRTKLYAFCDRQIDLDDCVALKPSQEELRSSYPWISSRDANIDWPEHVRTSILSLARNNLGYEDFNL